MGEYFVKIKNPEHVQRNILESSKEMIHCLQSYQKIALIRDAKKKNIQLLREQLREVEILIKSLKENLPGESLQEIERMFPEMKEKPAAKKRPSARKQAVRPVKVKGVKVSPAVQAKPSKATVAPSSEDSRVKGLESSLLEIERRLKELK